MTMLRLTALAAALLTLTACNGDAPEPAAATTADAAAAPVAPPAVADYYGTLEPMAEHAVYFVVTDRFVNGDEGNDQRDQGGAHPTFGLPHTCEDGTVDSIGYLGGDFRGLLDQADYVHDMGFGAVWITPIVDNPDEAFTGGTPPTCSSILTDQGKTGYHGYWGMNFYKVDEHLESADLRFADLTAGLHGHGLKVILDIVGNHGSPAWTMPEKQPGFGQVFAADGTLVADHGNLPPEQLDPAGNPLHAFYNTKPDLAQLGDFNPDSPQVMDYLVGAYTQWLDQGVDAMRVDTVRQQTPAFWKAFNARLRAHRPGLFMFGEVFEYDIATIAPWTGADSGSMSVLDFPMKKALSELMDGTTSDFATLAAPLALDSQLYANPYELMTFYDNHDMGRLNADDDGFVDAHNWLFTARGIPVIYYGSEIGFMRGKVEHAGNRNYFGVENVAAAKEHRIREQLARIANLRRESIALQRGLQVNVELAGDRAAFYRVYQRNVVAQVALVLLNKGDAPADFRVDRQLQAGTWRGAFSGETREVGAGGVLEAQVPAHGVEVFLLDAAVTEPALLAELDKLMQAAAPHTNGG